mgnify:CR=1 FL=1
MRLNEFVELGFIVQVDVPVMETREFNVEKFIKGSDSAGNYDSDTLDSFDWVKFYNSRRYAILGPNGDIMKSNLEENELKEAIKNL